MNCSRFPGSQVPGWCMKVLIFCFFLILSLRRHQRPEGCSSTMRSAEARNSPLANDHGVQEHFGFGHPVHVKRSYLRALKRAKRDGICWYRGRSMTHDHLVHFGHFHDVMVPSRHLSRPTDNKHGRAATHKRFKVMSWNAGGLNWDTFVPWLQTCSFDAVIVQETHWQHEAQWKTMGWRCFHTGLGQTHRAGTLIMISPQICDDHHIAFATIQPGRILHVRCYFGDSAIDIVSIYQHAWNSSRGKEHVLKNERWCGIGLMLCLAVFQCETH